MPEMPVNDMQIDARDPSAVESPCELPRQQRIPTASASSGETHPNPPKTLQSLQVLRAWAALIVVITHVGDSIFGRYGVWCLPHFTHAGIMGVDVFFCLSGFIMYYTSWNSFGLPGAWLGFLGRRLLRIYPIYWIVTIATLVACLIPASHLMLRDRSLGYLVNSFLLLPQNGSPVITQGWTLVHEVRFYLVFGLLLVGSRRLAFWLLLAWGVGSLTTLAVSFLDPSLLDAGIVSRAANFFFHPNSVEFILGVGAAYVIRRWATPRWFDCIVFPTAAIVTAAVMVWFPELLTSAKYSAFILFVIPSFLLVLGAALAERRWRPRMPTLGVALGDASYSTYLIHNLVAIPIVWNLLPSGASPTFLIACAVATVLVVHAGGWLVHVVAERPLHQLARRYSRGPSAAEAAGTAAAGAAAAERSA